MSHPSLFSLKSHRLRICLLLMIGLYATVSMRVNLSMGVTCMVNTTANAKPATLSNTSQQVEPSGTCYRRYDEVSAKEDGYGGPLLWSSSMQSLLFSATFYGGLVTIAISGYIADRFGPKMILLFAAIDFSIMTMMGPFLASNSYWAYFGARFIMGLGEGFIFPCLNSMAAKWFPPSEKSTVGAIYTSGNQLAAGFTSFLVAGLCSSPLGWPSIFYIFGSLGIIWAIVWQIFATNYPNENKWISEEERIYIEKNLANKQQSQYFQENRVPWRELLFGKVVLANYTSQFAYNFSASIMQAFLPTYFKDVLFIPIRLNGLFTMVPFISQLVSKNIFGVLSDYMKRHEILDPDVSVKVFQAIGAIGSAVSLIALATLPSCEHPYIALPILMAYGIFFSAGICGFFTSLLSIAPPYSGTMTSISMTYATIANLSGPILITFIDFMGWPNKWMITFLSAASFNILSGIFYVFYGEARVQEWAKPNEKEKPRI
ncbi:unnamed protein product, partial [Mesorhabditis belari]|uniref:Major facilitator superfamily (MFS) profile domain-containing protein n=1 Tax=Mesorhabditis belari TaxID=2138241 RepID=A0AAF3F6S7_9BILA